MDKAPEQISLAKLEVLVMPNGEILCLGNSIGTVRWFGRKLSDIKVAV